MSETTVTLAVLTALAFPAVAAAWLVRRRTAPARKALPPPTLFPPAPSPAGAPRPQRLRLAPEYRCSPLWDDETGTMVDPASLGLSPELVQGIADWDAVFQATFHADDPIASGFGDVAAELAWVRQGDAILRDLGREWPGPVANQISALTPLMRQARQDLDPWQALPRDRLARIGAHCGIAEIEAAIRKLDELSRLRSALPEWDGDSQDDIAAAQETLHGILAAAPCRYVNIIAGGLDSAEWRTRVHVALALARSDRATALPILRDALAREEDDLARQLIALALAEAESPDP